MLIAICGIDGSGKTTQIKLLSQYIEENYGKTLITKSPTDWYRNNYRVRDYLSGKLQGTPAVLNELSLLSACDKLKQLQEEICNSKEKYIITDRYIYSTFVYFMARGVSLDYLVTINKYLPQPFLTIYIDTDENVAFSRIKKRDGDNCNIEEKNIEFMKNIRSIFLEQPWGKSDNYCIINGNSSINNVFEEIKKIVDTKLKM